ASRTRARRSSAGTDRGAARARTPALDRCCGPDTTKDARRHHGRRSCPRFSLQQPTLLRVFPQRLFQLLAPSVQPREHRAGRRSGELCDLARLVSVDVGQHQSGAMGGVNLLERGGEAVIVEQVEEIEVQAVGVREWIFLDERVEQREALVLQWHVMLVRRVPPPSVRRGGEEDLREPEARPLTVAQRLVGAERAEERVLDKVLGGGSLAAQLARQRVEVVEVRLDERGERRGRLGSRCMHVHRDVVECPVYCRLRAISSRRGRVLKGEKHLRRTTWPPRHRRSPTASTSPSWSRRSVSSRRTRAWPSSVSALARAGSMGVAALRRSPASTAPAPRSRGRARTPSRATSHRSCSARTPPQTRWRPCYTRSRPASRSATCTTPPRAASRSSLCASTLKGSWTSTRSWACPRRRGRDSSASRSPRR